MQCEQGWRIITAKGYYNYTNCATRRTFPVAQIFSDDQRFCENIILDRIIARIHNVFSTNRNSEIGQLMMIGAHFTATEKYVHTVMGTLAE